MPPYRWAPHASVLLKDYFIGLLRSHITKEQNEHRRIGLGWGTDGGAWRAAPPSVSSTCLCISQSLRRGLSTGSVSAGVDERLTTDWLNAFPPRPLWPRITQCAQSLLPARCRGMRAQRETTLLRCPLALGAQEPGRGIRGPHFPVATGKEPGEKRGQGRPANKGPLALSWKKQQRRTK